MAAPKSETRVQVEGRELTLTNLEKVLYPAVGFTKGQVVDYYRHVAPAILPHLGLRALTLKRYPNGVEGHMFYEKRCPSYAPEWFQTVEVWSGRNKDVVPYCVVDGLPALLWVANTASLELHTSLARAEDPATPTAVVFDLDPGAPATSVECALVALRLRALFEQLGLESVVKSSGSKGMQLYVPLNTATDYDTTKQFALQIAQALEQQTPDEVTSVMKKDLRGGKVFIDWSQNDFHKTTVCAYSLRAKDEPRVSTPLAWDEVEAHAKGRKPTNVHFTADEVRDRIDEHGDLFAPMAELEQNLPALR